MPRVGRDRRVHAVNLLGVGYGSSASERLMNSEQPPRLGRGLLIRSALVGFAIVLLSAGAFSASAILRVDQAKDAWIGGPDRQIEVPELTRAEAGGARTFLILGSDQRWDDKKYDVPGRSDAIMMARVDPDKSTIAVLSIPRDLKVKIPGFAHPDKINAAYANGGPKSTVHTIKQLFTEATGEPFHIHNVINLTFGGFRQAIDYMHGVYVDIDHRYLNDNTGRDKYATIDVQPGYQRLKGTDALDYVRFRHTDNDFLRGSRQQDFLRQVRNQPKSQKLLSLDKVDEVGHIFSKYIQVDKSFRSTKQIMSLMKLGMYSRGKSVRQVRFDASDGGNYVVASPEQLRATWNEFMHPKSSSLPKKKKPASASKKRSKKTKKLDFTAVPGLHDSHHTGEDLAILVSRKVGFPFYFPTLTAANSIYVGTEPRIYKITDDKGLKRRAYRLVLSRRSIGEYYGIQGTTWKYPPILNNPSDTKFVRGRKLLLFYDGSKLRLVGWRSKRASYWVSNTLTRSLDNNQMIAIAASLKQLR